MDLSQLLHPQHRRHFSAVACEGCIYAVGGWYLDSLVAPDSNTALYTAVERYDPWEDTWRFVSSLSLSQLVTCNLPHSEEHPSFISTLGLSPHCRSLTSSLPCPCLMMYPLPRALATVFTCLGVSRGLERNCSCSITQGLVRCSQTES